MSGAIVTAIVGLIMNRMKGDLSAHRTGAVLASDRGGAGASQRGDIWVSGAPRGAGLRWASLVE